MLSRAPSTGAAAAARRTGACASATTARPANYGGTSPGAALAGSRRQQFRELAHQLDTSARQTLSVAERSASNNDRGRSILADLRHFAEQAGNLHDRSD